MQFLQGQLSDDNHTDHGPAHKDDSAHVLFRGPTPVALLAP
jgi:hypothetical protein